MLINFFDKFYLPHYNSCVVGEFFGVHVYVYFYLISLIVIFFSYLLLKNNKKEIPSNQELFVNKALWTILVALIICQTIGQISFLRWELNLYYIKGSSERYPPYFKRLSDFALFSKSVLPGKHNAKLITDLDLTRELPGVFTTWVLGYFLYPIDLKGIREGEAKDCLVVFMKENPYQSIPVGYRVIGDFKNDLIAIKE